MWVYVVVVMGVFTSLKNYPHTAKTRNSMRKKDMPGVPQDQQRPLRRFQENNIPNTYISVLFYSVQISFV